MPAAQRNRLCKGCGAGASGRSSHPPILAPGQGLRERARRRTRLARPASPGAPSERAGPDGPFAAGLAPPRRDVFERLPADLQARLARIASEVGHFAQAEGERLDGDLVGKMRATMQVNEVDRSAFASAAARIYRQFGTEVPGGGALIAAIRRLR